MARATSAELAAALRIDEDDPRLTPLLAAYDSYLTKVIAKNTVPPEIQKEALIMLASYAYDRPITPGTSWVAIFRNSGAQNLMSPWVKRGAGIIGATSGPLQAASPGTPDLGHLAYLPPMPDPPDSGFTHYVLDVDSLGNFTWAPAHEAGRALVASVLKYGGLDVDGTTVLRTNQRYLYQNQESLLMIVSDPKPELRYDTPIDQRGYYYIQIPDEYRIGEGGPPNGWTDQGGGLLRLQDQLTYKAPWYWLYLDLVRVVPLPTEETGFDVDKATNDLVDHEEDDTAYMTVRTTFRAIARKVKMATMRIPGIAYIVRASDVDAALVRGAVEADLDQTRIMTISAVFRFVTKFVVASRVKALIESLMGDDRVDVSAIKGITAATASSGIGAGTNLIPAATGQQYQSAHVVTSGAYSSQFQYAGFNQPTVPAAARALYIYSPGGTPSVVGVGDLIGNATFNGVESSDVHHVEYWENSGQQYLHMFTFGMTATRQLMVRIRTIDISTGRIINRGDAGASARFRHNKYRIDYL